MWEPKGSTKLKPVSSSTQSAPNTRDGRAPLDGGVVTDAREDYSERGANAHVSMTMNAEGSSKWAPSDG